MRVRVGELVTWDLGLCRVFAYLTYRFFSEWIRPEPQLWLGLTGYQWATLALAPVFIWLWRRDALAFRAAANSGFDLRATKKAAR